MTIFRHDINANIAVVKMLIGHVHQPDLEMKKDIALVDHLVVITKKGQDIQVNLTLSNLRILA